MANRISFCWRTEYCDGEDICYRAHLPSGYSLTVLDRMTGFGYRDVETGLRCHGTGRFWLASGHRDIRDELHKMESEDDIVQWVKDRANNCFGEAYGRYPHLTHKRIMELTGGVL